MKILGKELHVKRLCLLMALLLIGFSGCSEDEPKPKFEPAPSTSSTSTPPSTPPPTTDPPVKKLSPEETVKAWVKGLNHAYDTGDTASALSVSSANCAECLEWLDGIPEIYDAGGYITTKGWTVVNAKRERGKGSDASVLSAIKWARATTVFSKGKAPVPVEASSHIMRFELDKENGSWALTNFLFIE